MAMLGTTVVAAMAMAMHMPVPTTSELRWRQPREQVDDRHEALGGDGREAVEAVPNPLEHSRRSRCIRGESLSGCT